jgi:hypothetical protein
MRSHPAVALEHIDGVGQAHFQLSLIKSLQESRQRGTVQTPMVKGLRPAPVAGQSIYRLALTGRAEAAKRNLWRLRAFLSYNLDATLVKRQLSKMATPVQGAIFHFTFAPQSAICDEREHGNQGHLT